MNGIRKLLVFVAALAFAAFSVTSMADPVNKHFALTMVPGIVDNAQQNSTFVANLVNDNPSGSSAQFGSFVISVANVSGITIVGADADPDFGANQSVVVSTDGLSVAVSNLKPNVMAGQTYSLTIHIKGCGDGNAASAIVYTGTSFTGATYADDHKGNETMNVPCGVVACATPPFATLVGSAISANGVSGYRDVYNKNGSTCSSVDYFVTNLLAAPAGFEHVRWDTQDSAAFFYTVSGPLLHKLAWLTDVNGNPVFVLGQQCDQTNPGLPAPYGTLLSDNGHKQIKVDTSTAFYPLPATFPFPIVIETERLLVTSISGQTWFVTRGQGGTTAQAHPAGVFVMSTPLPLLAGPLTPAQLAAGYVVGNQAQMCFVAGAPVDSRSGIIDIGDGWGNP